MIIPILLQRDCKVSDAINVSANAFSSTWTQWSVKASNTVHVLPVLGLLLLSDSIDVVPWYLGVLCALERRETHHLSHQRLLFVFVRHCTAVAICCRFWVNLHSVGVWFVSFRAWRSLVCLFVPISMGWSIAVRS